MVVGWERERQGGVQEAGVRGLWWPIATPGSARCSLDGADRCCSAHGPGTRSSGDAEVWCRAEIQCQSWEWRAWSQMLSPGSFWNSETCLAIFQQRCRPAVELARVLTGCRVADSGQQTATKLLQPGRGRGAGEERRELHECCFWISSRCLSAPLLLHLQAVDEHSAICCHLCGGTAPLAVVDGG